MGTPVLVDFPSLRLEPDIANISRRAIYEIRPMKDIAGAATKLAEDLAAFARLGVTFYPGPSGAPGTFGLTSAPGGWATFWSPLPGVIGYNYHPNNGSVPVAVPNASTGRTPSATSLIVAGAAAAGIVIALDPPSAVVLLPALAP